MNINAQELLLINKNMKFRALKSTQEPTAPATEPVAPVGNGMKALEMQAQNNIAFQGMSATSKTLAKGLLMAMLAAGTVSTTQSCVQQTVIVDNSEMIALYQQMLDYQKKLVDGQEEGNSYLKFLYEQYAEGGDFAAFQAAALQYMIYDAEMQKNLQDQLIANGKTEEEVVKAINELKELFEKGKYADALAKYEALLASIDGKLDVIIEKFDTLIKNVNTNHDEYMFAKKEEIDYLSKLYDQGKIDQDYYQKLLDSQNTANMYLEKFTAEIGQLKEFFMSEENYNKFIEDINKGNIRKEDIEALFEKFGVKVLDVLNLSREEIVEVLKNIEKSYVQVANNMSQQLNDVIAVIKDLGAKYPGLDASDLDAAIDTLVAAINAGKTDITAELKAVQEKQDALYGLVKEMYADMGEYFGEASTYNKLYNEKWDALLGKIDVFSKDVAEVKADQKDAKLYLQALVGQGDVIIDELQKLEGTTGSDITLNELKKLWKEQDEEAYNNFVKFNVETGLVNLPGDVATIKDYLAGLKGLMQHKCECSAKLDEIISLIEQGKSDEAIKDLEDLDKNFG